MLLMGNNAFIAAQQQRSLPGVEKYINTHDGIHGRRLRNVLAAAYRYHAVSGPGGNALKKPAN
jgi:hypothetical protein